MQFTLPIAKVVSIWIRDHTFMTSMKNAQFLQPPSPVPVCLNGSELSKTPSPERRNSGYKPPPIPIPVGILTAYRLYLVDVSITCHARATHKSLQLKFNSNETQYSAVKLKQTRLTWNAKDKTKMLSKAEPDTCLEHL